VRRSRTARVLARSATIRSTQVFSDERPLELLGGDPYRVGPTGHLPSSAWAMAQAALTRPMWLNAWG